MEHFFNQMVQCVVSRGLGPRRVDGSIGWEQITHHEEVPRAWSAAAETKPVKIAGQKEPAIQESYVYGWKVLVLIEVRTRLPLASDQWYLFKSMKVAGCCPYWNKLRAIWGREHTSAKW